MRQLRARCAVAVVLGLLLAVHASADAVENILNQVTLSQYQADLRILTGVDPVPTNPPYTLTNRYSLGQDIRVAGQWIYDQFAAEGLVAQQQVFNAAYGANIIGELPGTTRPDDIYVICGHYDAVQGTPGCDDNGSGTAAVMTAARILSQYQFEGSIRFIAFSGEEQIGVGSNAYAQAAQIAGENIVATINLDMILHPGFDNASPDPDYDLDIDTNSNSLGLAQYLAGQFGAYTTINAQVHNDANGGSDHWCFWQHGYPALGVSENTADEIWGGSNGEYHRSTDTFSNPHLDWEFGLQTVRGGMAGVIGLAGLVPEPSSLMVLIALLVPLRHRARRCRSGF